MVTSAADAIFTILERDGLLGHAADAAIASHSDDGLDPGGWRAQVTVNEARRLPPGPDCFERGDVFAQPASSTYTRDVCAAQPTTGLSIALRERIIRVSAHAVGSICIRTKAIFPQRHGVHIWQFCSSARSICTRYGLQFSDRVLCAFMATVSGSTPVNGLPHFLPGPRERPAIQRGAVVASGGHPDALFIGAQAGWDSPASAGGRPESRGRELVFGASGPTPGQGEGDQGEPAGVFCLLACPPCRWRGSAPAVVTSFEIDSA
jgi:hypothetical protein